MLLLCSKPILIESNQEVAICINYNLQIGSKETLIEMTPKSIRKYRTNHRKISKLIHVYLKLSLYSDV